MFLPKKGWCINFPCNPIKLDIQNFLQLSHKYHTQWQIVPQHYLKTSDKEDIVADRFIVYLIDKYPPCRY